MPRVSELSRSTTIRCPKCGFTAEADPIQLQGRCSLICPECGFHFYITPKIDGVAEVWEGRRVELAE